jgi:hypothetical protein
MWNVTNEFKEVNHEGHIYKKGDVYPAEGYTADEERVKFLQTTHETYGVAFLEESKEEPKNEEVQEVEEPQQEEVQEPQQEEVQAAETQVQPEGAETEQEKPKRAPRKAKQAPKEGE